MLASDLAHAVRGLRKQRGLAPSVVLTLGIAIATTSVIAALANQALREPLPYRDASRLLLLWEKSKGGDYRLASYPTFLDWQAATPRSLAGLGFVRGDLDVLSTGEGPLRATTGFVSRGYFKTLGATPLLGRFFTSDEEAAGHGNAAVLSERLWRSQFGGDRGLIGRSITLSGRSVTVVGVVSTTMAYPFWADLWRPISAIVDSDPALASRHHHTDSRLIVRLARGVEPGTAMRDLSIVQQRLATTYAEHGPDWITADFQPLSWEFVGTSAPALKTLAGAAVMVLLVACVNVATLLLLRAFAREREFAIRSALGASHLGVARLTLTESGLLGSGAGVVALLLTWWGLGFVRGMAPDSLPRSAELRFDVRVAGLVVALALVATTIIASAPFVRAVRRHTLEPLRAGWQPTSGGRGGNRWRSTLAAAQLAMALTLLAGTGLLIESFRRLSKVDLGFDPHHLALFWIAPPAPKYDQPDQAVALYARLRDAAAGVPGVEGVAIANHGPLTGGYVVTKYVVPGRVAPADGSDAALYKTVDEDYLDVMKGRLLRGRWFAATDIRGAGDGVVINERLAKRVWPNADPVGQPITVFRSSQARPGFGSPLPSVVIGVIADMHHISISDDPVDEVYVPYTREVWPGIGLLIRARGEPLTLGPALRRALLGVEPDLPVLGSAGWRTFEPIGTYIDRLLAPRQLVLRLVLGFAGVAVTLAAIGVYVVIAFGVAQRTREIGIRMAVGATTRDVMRLVLRQSLALATVGAVAGIIGGIAIARVLRATLDSVLYRTSPFAVLPLVIAAGALGGITLAAAWVPARSAAGVDPVTALRSE